MTKKLLRRDFLACVASIALAYGGSALAQEPLRVGAINPYSGPLALGGDETTRGYELAAEQINAKGGLLGRKIQIIRGNATNAQEAIAAVDQLSTRDKVDLFVGTFVSAVSATASEAAVQYNKVYWDTNALATELTERGLPNFVRSGPNSIAFADLTADAVVKFIAPALSKQPAQLKVWVTHEDSIYGTTVGRRLGEQLTKASVQVLRVVPYSARAIDMTDIILRAKEAAPDVWISIGYLPDGHLLLRTARDQKFRPAAVMTPGSVDTKESLEALGVDGLEGNILVTYPRYDISEKFGPGKTAYLAAYQAKFGGEPIMPQSMNAFVGFQILAEAIQAAGSADPKAVRAAAAKLEKPVGSYATGYGVKFDEKMQNTLALPTVSQWQGGKVVTLYPQAAAPEGARLIGVGGK
jgi:branched-chain amino acid transport system substrate-binding protein